MKPQVASAAATELERLSPYHGFLFLLLATATLFDGFDAAMLGFATPELMRSLEIGVAEWGLVASVARLGVMASFFFLFFADRIGRRWVMLATIVGFTVANFATALVTTKAQLMAAQFVSRLFLSAELSLAIIMVSEEFPTRLRGQAIAVLTSLATVGVMLMAKLQSYVLLPEGAENNAIHALGSAMVSGAQGALGLALDTASWRSLYALGALPLGLVLFLRAGMRETRRFEAARIRSARAARRGWRDIVREATVPWRREYRHRTAMVALLWNCVYLVTGASTVYWIIFAREVIQLTTFQVGSIVFWGYAWTTNLAGRVTEVAVPLLIGLLVAPLGIPGALTVVAAGPLLGAMLVLRYAPETRGMTLEEIASAMPAGDAQTAVRSERESRLAT